MTYERSYTAEEQGRTWGWSSRAAAQGPQNVRAPTKYIFKYSVW
jgi:hypothetical protein